MDPGADTSTLKKRTRPARFVATDAQRQIVVTLAGTLTPHDQIARCLSIGLATLERHFKSELANGRGQLLVSLKQVVCRHALNGSIRAATWLIERLDPAFAPPKRAEEPAGEQVRYIVVKNGLPDLSEMPSAANNWGEDWDKTPKPNGEDAHEDGGAPSPSIIDRTMDE